MQTDNLYYVFKSLDQKICIFPKKLMSGKFVFLAANKRFLYQASVEWNSIVELCVFCSAFTVDWREMQGAAAMREITLNYNDRSEFLLSFHIAKSNKEITIKAGESAANSFVRKVCMHLQRYREWFIHVCKIECKCLL
jgi:hypothetical protein